MKKDYLLGILFFGSLWGAIEAGWGGFLYKNHILHASVPLTIIAFMILTIAKIYLPQRGSLVFIGSLAMLYKFLNTPFYACHLLAIFLLGVAYEASFSLLKIKNKTLLGLIATYIDYIFFALSITYIFRYHYWIDGGLPKILRYVGLSGTMAAIGNLFAVPLSFNFGQILKKKTANPFIFESRLATGSISLITLVLWLLAAVKCF